MLKQIIDFIFPRGPYTFDSLTEGVYADQYTSEQIRSEISQQYRQRWDPELQPRTPDSHPWLFDPLEPPPGWHYDPYYECWIKFGD